MREESKKQIKSGNPSMDPATWCVLPYESDRLVGTGVEPHLSVSEKDLQDAYWNKCTQREKENLRKSYNEFLKDDIRGRSLLENVCGKHNLQDGE